MKFLLIISLFILSSCGFTPVYGTKTVSNDLNTVAIASIPDRNGQMVRNFLIDRIYKNGYPSAPQFTLSVSPIEENIVEIGIDKDDEASRAQLRQRAVMTLTDMDTNKPVLTRTIRATSGYNILTGQFTTYVSQEDARQQSLRALSDNIITQLEIYFSQ